jgi:hypothetical protein
MTSKILVLYSLYIFFLRMSYFSSENLMVYFCLLYCFFISSFMNSIISYVLRLVRLDLFMRKEGPSSCCCLTFIFETVASFFIYDLLDSFLYISDNFDAKNSFYFCNIRISSCFYNIFFNLFSTSLKNLIDLYKGLIF